MVDPKSKSSLGASIDNRGTSPFLQRGRVPKVPIGHEEQVCDAKSTKPFLSCEGLAPRLA